MGLNYLEIYGSGMLKVSFRDDSGYERFVTGKIFTEDETHIVLDTIKQERISIRKELIGNCRQDRKDIKSESD
jgi:hypothetical protein